MLTESQQQLAAQMISLTKELYPDIWQEMLGFMGVGSGNLRKMSRTTLRNLIRFGRRHGYNRHTSIEEIIFGDCAAMRND